MRHAFLKPRGYPGDFQLMEAIYRNEPSGTPRGRWLDAWALQLPFAQAVRTRRDALIDLLAQVCLAGGRRVTNIACGSAPELAAVQRRLPFASITLLDQDDGALLAASRALLTDTTTAISLLHRPVRDLLAGSCRLELGQDVIYPLGLYDYLPASTAATLTSRLWEAVGPGGLLVVGNFAQGAQNDRAFLKAALDWWLMYRTQLSPSTAARRDVNRTCPWGDSGSGKHQIRSLVLYVDLVGSRPIWPAHIGRVVGLDGSRRTSRIVRMINRMIKCIRQRIALLSARRNRLTVQAARCCCTGGW